MVLGAEGMKKEEEKLNLKVFMLTEMKSVPSETRKSHDTTNSPLIHSHPVQSHLRQDAVPCVNTFSISSLQIH